MRGQRRVLLALCLALSLPLVAVWSATAQQRRPKVGPRTLATKSGDEVQVRLNVGDILLRTWDKAAVLLRGADDYSVRQTQGRISITGEADWEGYGSSDLEISLPQRSQVTLSTESGDIEVRGRLEGAFSARTSAGDVEFQTIIGRVEVVTLGGDIAGALIEGDADLKSSGGEISIKRTSGDLTARTAGGSIELADVGGELDASTAGGDIDVGQVGGQADLRTAGGDVEVRRAQGSLRMRTAGGDIYLTERAGPTSARTAGGDIVLNSVTGTVQARTSGGDVRVTWRPSGNEESRLESQGGDLEIRIEGNAGVTIEAVIFIRGQWDREHYAIHSDFPPESDTGGSRKEIRHLYRINGGGASLKMETTNGDIRIRKAR